MKNCDCKKEGGMSKLSKLFKGKESYSEEMKEAKAIKSGKITPSEYAKGENMEESKKMKKGGMCKGYAKGGSVSSRADGVAQRGKTNCKMV